MLRCQVSIRKSHVSIREKHLTKHLSPRLIDSHLTQTVQPPIRVPDVFQNFKAEAFKVFLTHRMSGSCDSSFSCHALRPSNSMCSAGDYTEAVAKAAEENQDFVMGFISIKPAAWKNGPGSPGTSPPRFFFLKFLLLQNSAHGYSANC